ncbi:MAG: hypothetical protein ACODAC_12455, partial [Pseudomonadota bacterium]
MRDALDPDRTIGELRALLASYEDRLSRTSETAPGHHATRIRSPEPLFLINGVAVDLRASARKNLAEIEAPDIVDCFRPREPERFQFVLKVASGVFRVHPRQGKVTAAVVGPISGPAPGGVVATVQTAHSAAPPVRFHIGTWRGEIDIGAIEAKFAATGRPCEEPPFLTVPPRHPGYIVSTDSPQVPSDGTALPDGSESAWSLVLATVADPPDEISFAWAEFSDVILLFPGDSGFEA